MSLEVYKIIHIAGLALLFASLGGLVTHAMNGGSRDDNPSRKLLSASHGVALLLVFVSGFGMHAKLHLDGFPGWFLTKVAL
ncbi:MAG TPA: hypothetical protein PKA64_20850, partial [Myxococcota bacterium]|nr:hypothetical protein [Myxococcota bacterium]